MPLPAVPYPATIEVTRAADDRASVAFRGNRYSVTPGLGGTELTCGTGWEPGRWRSSPPAGR